MENIEETIKAAENKLLEVRAAKKELEQERALRAAPVDETKEAHTKEIRELQSGMKEKRAVTLNGTGTRSFVRELIKNVQAKKDVLNRFRYFYGPNATTVIPVWAADFSKAVEVDEAGTFESESKSLATKTLTAKAFCKSIPVSAELLKLSELDFEAELMNIIQDVYAETIVDAIFNGTPTAFKSLYEGTTEVKATKANLTALAKFALDLNDKMDNGVIIMNPAVYAEVEASDASAKEKAWAKELIERKTIEGIPVVLTSYANPDYVAIGGNFANYAVAVADQIEIKPKETVGSLVTTYDVSMFMSGLAPLPTNLYSLKVGA